MRVLVTGGHGFIGTHLVRRLLADGAEVRALYRRAGHPPTLAGLDVEICPGDVRDPAALRRAVAGAEEIHHLAGLTSSLSRRAMFATNAGGTGKLLRAAVEAGFAGRMVICSSLAAAGPAPLDGVVDEHTRPRPVTWYGESKLAAEAAAVAAATAGSVTILRPPAVYGPGDIAFLPIFRAAAAGFSLVPGTPTKRYSMLYAEDLAAAMVATARSPATAGGVYCVAHPEIVTLSDMIEAAERAVGRRSRRVALPTSFMHLVGRVTDLVSQLTGRSSVLGSQRMREVAEGDWVCTGAALERATGFSPAVDLGSGFEHTAAWYREHGLLRRPAGS